ESSAIGLPPSPIAVAHEAVRRSVRRCDTAKDLLHSPPHLGRFDVFMGPAAVEGCPRFRGYIPSAEAVESVVPDPPVKNVDADVNVVVKRLGEDPRNDTYLGDES